MRFLVWGAGAIGGTIGAYLALAGHNVTFVDRAADHPVDDEAGERPAPDGPDQPGRLGRGRAHRAGFV